MRRRTPTDTGNRIREAVSLAVKNPAPNPWMAAFRALWAGNSVPTGAEIQAAWDLLAEQLTALRCAKLEEKILSAKSASKKKRLRAELRQRILPPQVKPAQPAAPSDGHRELAESYGVDIDPAYFLRRHEEYRKAQRERRPVAYFVHRKGEPVTIELHPPPAAASSGRPSAGGRPRLLSLDDLRADLKKHHGSQVDRARRLHVSVRTLRDRQRQLDKAPRSL